MERTIIRYVSSARGPRPLLHASDRVLLSRSLRLLRQLEQALPRTRLHGAAAETAAKYLARFLEVTDPLRDVGEPPAASPSNAAAAVGIEKSLPKGDQ